MRHFLLAMQSNSSTKFVQGSQPLFYLGKGETKVVTDNGSDGAARYCQGHGSLLSTMVYLVSLITPTIEWKMNHRIGKHGTD
jgi:hypothetical protein